MSIHISWITGRILKRSPLVQSGDMSQLARMIAGVTIIVTMLRATLIPLTRLSSISFSLSYDWLPVHVSAAYVDVTDFMLYPLGEFSISIKNPIIATKVIHIYVKILDAISFTILPLEHNSYFFANISSFLFFCLICLIFFLSDDEIEFFQYIRSRVWYNHDRFRYEGFAVIYERIEDEFILSLEYAICPLKSLDICEIDSCLTLTRFRRDIARYHCIYTYRFE